MKLDLLAKFLLAAAPALLQLNTQAALQVPVAAENCMVVTAQHLATHIGVDVLKAGGREAPLSNFLLHQGERTNVKNNR